LSIDEFNALCERKNLEFAKMCALLVNLFSTEKHSADEFMPKGKEMQTPENMLAVVKAFDRGLQNGN